MTNCEHTTHRENTSSPTSPPIISSRLLSITSPSLVLSTMTDDGSRGGGGGDGDDGGPTTTVSARGVQFFVVAGCRDALIRKIEARVDVGDGLLGYDAQVEVFAKAGTYARHETDGDAWEHVYNGHVAVGDNDEDEDGGPPPPSSSGTTTRMRMAVPPPLLLHEVVRTTTTTAKTTTTRSFAIDVDVADDAAPERGRRRAEQGGVFRHDSSADAAAVASAS